MFVRFFFLFETVFLVNVFIITGTQLSSPFNLTYCSVVDLTIRHYRLYEGILPFPYDRLHKKVSQTRGPTRGQLLEKYSIAQDLTNFVSKLPGQLRAQRQ